jgi:hypothetical protein
MFETLQTIGENLIKSLVMALPLYRRTAMWSVRATCWNCSQAEMIVYWAWKMLSALPVSSGTQCDEILCS